MATILDDITSAWTRAAPTAGTDPRRRALEFGLWADAAIPRYSRVDSAELVGFIHLHDPDGMAAPDDLADAIVDRFKLEEN